MSAQRLYQAQIYVAGKDLRLQRKRRRSEVDDESPIPSDDSRGLLAQSSIDGGDRSSLESLAVPNVPNPIPRACRKPLSTSSAATALPPDPSRSIRSKHLDLFQNPDQQKNFRMWDLQWHNHQTSSNRWLASSTQWYSAFHDYTPTHPADAEVDMTAPEMMTPEFVMRSTQYSSEVKKRFVGELSVHWANLKQHYYYGGYPYAETQIRGISRAIVESNTVLQNAAALKPQRPILAHRVALQIADQVREVPAPELKTMTVSKSAVNAETSTRAPASQPRDQKRFRLPIVDKITTIPLNATKEDVPRSEVIRSRLVNCINWTGDVLLLGLVHMTCRAADQTRTTDLLMASLTVVMVLAARIIRYCDTRKNELQLEPCRADELIKARLDERQNRDTSGTALNAVIKVEQRRNTNPSQIEAQTHHTSQRSGTAAHIESDESSSEAAKRSDADNATIEALHSLRHDQKSSLDDHKEEHMSHAALVLRLASCEAETSKMKEVQVAYKVAYRKQTDELKSSREKEKKARDICDMYASAMDKRETETMVLENAHDTLGAKKRILEKRNASLQREKAKLVEHVAHLRDVVDLHEAERITKHDTVKQNFLSLILQNATRYREQVARHEINQKDALEQILTLKTQNQKLVETEAAMVAQLKDEGEITKLEGFFEKLDNAVDDDHLRQQEALEAAHRKEMVKVYAKLKKATRMEKSLQALRNKHNQLEYRNRWSIKEHVAVEAGLTERLASESREVDRLKIEVQALKKENRELSGIEEWVRVRGRSSLLEAANGAGEVDTVAENQEIADDTQGWQQPTMAGNGQVPMKANGLVSELTAESSESDEDNLTPTRAQIEFALAHNRFWKPQQTAGTDKSDTVSLVDNVLIDEGELIEHGDADDAEDV